MLERLAEASGIKTPAQAELVASHRKRKGKKLSNKDWQSATDEESCIAELKDGRTHMAYKPEHVVDLESGAFVSAVIHPADQGNTTTIATALDDTQAKLCAIREKEEAPGIDEPFDLVADKGYHSRGVLKDLPDCCRSRISEPKHAGQLRWHGDVEARKAVYGNRARIRSCKGKALLRARGEKLERFLPFVLTGGVCGAAFCAGPRI